MLKTQLQLLSTQLQMLTEKRNKKKKRKLMGGQVGPSYTPSAPASSVAPVSSKPKAKRNSLRPGEKVRRIGKKRAHAETSDDEKEPDEITYEQKRELSENINILPQDKLAAVFEIIKENANLNVS
jgi:Bromodomain extra-terminal - transcription regulation